MHEMRNPALGPSAPAAPYAHPAFNWTRFWIRSGVSVIAFNVIAGFITWYWILPRLFPRG